jgi:tRNA G18 (ribose-2'-O)-methylase SpoU
MFRKLSNSELNRPDLETFKAAPKQPVVLVLDNIRSQHNIGSAFRSADAFAVEKIWLCGICAVPPSAEIHKSALGAEDSVPWEHAGDTLDAVAALKADGYTVIAVEQTVHSVGLDTFIPKPGGRYALIFGNEVEGVRQDVVDAADLTLEIPQAGTKHSLNVSVAAGVVLWHFFCHSEKA